MTGAPGDTAHSVDLRLLAEAQGGMTPLLAEQRADLHINLVSLKPGTGVGKHVNGKAVLIV